MDVGTSSIHLYEACALWGFRQACLSRTLLGTASWERGRPARTGPFHASGVRLGDCRRILIRIA